MKKHIILIPYLLLLLGCSNYIPPSNISNMQEVSDIKTLTPQKEQDKTLIFSDQKWWLTFNDENLNKLVNITLNSNTDLKIAMLNIEKASATIDAATNSAFKMGLYTNADYYGTSKNYTSSKALEVGGVTVVPKDALAGEATYTAGLGLKASYNFNFYDKYGNLANQQRYIAKSASFNSKLVELNLTTNLAKLYGYYLYLHREKDNLNSRLKTLTSIKNKVKISIDLGISVEEDLITIQNKILALNKYIYLNKFNQTTTVDTINSLSSYEYKRKIDQILLSSSKNNLFEHYLIIPNSISSDVIVNRPDVKYYLMMIESEKSKLTAVKSDFYPQISIGGDIGYKGLGLDNSFQDLSSLMWSFGPKVYLPLFNLSGIKANYKISGIQVNIFIENYNKTIYGAIKDINEKLTSAQMSKLNYKRYRRKL